MITLTISDDTYGATATATEIELTRAHIEAEVVRLVKVECLVMVLPGMSRIYTDQGPECDGDVLGEVATWFVGYQKAIRG